MWGKPGLWSQSTARRSLVGHERTHNPSPAASSMLGKKAVKKAKAKLKKGGRKRAHKGNPSPAVVSSLAGLVPGGSLVTGLLGGLGGRFRAPSEVRAAKVAPGVLASANGGNLTAAYGLMQRAAIPMLAKESAVWKATAAQLAPDVVAQVAKYKSRIPKADQSNPEAFAASVAASPFAAPGSAHEDFGAGLLAVANSRAGQSLTTAVVRGLTRSRRRGGYGYGRPRRSRRQYYDEEAGPVSSADVGGAVARGGATSKYLAAAGKAAGVAAAGAAAYLVTRAVLKYLGGKALGAEQAGVAASLAHHDAIVELTRQQGKPPTRAQLSEMKSELQRQLVALGYDPVTFQRRRTKTEQFLSDYNPED